MAAPLLVRLMLLCSLSEWVFRPDLQEATLILDMFIVERECRECGQSRVFLSQKVFSLSIMSCVSTISICLKCACYSLAARFWPWSTAQCMYHQACIHRLHGICFCNFWTSVTYPIKRQCDCSLYVESLLLFWLPCVLIQIFALDPWTDCSSLLLHFSVSVLVMTRACGPRWYN